MRERLPDTRESLTHKCVIHSLFPSGKVRKINVYLTVGIYADQRPAELFYVINVSGLKEEEGDGKERDPDVVYYETLRGWSKQWAIAISLCLQDNVPLSKIIEKFSYQDFPPSGMTENPDIPTCKSLPDYTVRWMEMRFTPKKSELIVAEIPDNALVLEELARDAHLSKPIAEEI